MYPITKSENHKSYISLVAEAKTGNYLEQSKNSMGMGF